MEERILALEAAVRELSERVQGLEASLAAGSATAAAGSPQSRAADAADLVPVVSLSTLSTGFGLGLSLVGRSCLVFCGAFLLRALTDAAVLPPAAGVVAGLAYAAAWMLAAGRAARSGASASAEAHGVSSVIIAFPLLVETTLRFQLLSAAAAGAVLVGLLGLGVAVAAWRQLRFTGWAVVVAGVVTALLLARLTLQIELFAAVLVALGITTMWLAGRAGWSGIQWMPAAAADLVVLLASLMVTAPGGPRAPYQGLSARAVLVVAVALLGGYLGSVAVRLFRNHGELGVFEVAQTAAAVTVGVGAAARIVGSTEAGALGVGLIAAVLGLSFYALAFAFVERRRGRGRSFLFTTTLGLVLTLFGGTVACDGGVLATAFCGLGLAAAAIGGRFDRVTLRVHAAVFLVAAAAVSGMIAATSDAFIASAGARWSSLSTPALVALLSLVLGYAVLVLSQSDRETPWFARLPRFVVAVVAGIALLAAAVRGLTLVVPAVAADPALLAALRSVVLALGVLGLAAAGHHQRLRELGWLVYPLLATAGFRLLVVDLRYGRPITLFPAFALFGIALLVAPRLLRRR